MVHSRFRRPRSKAFVPSLLALALIIACGGAQATSTPGAKGEAPTPALTPEAGVTAATPVAKATEARAQAMQAKYGGIVPMHAYAAPVTAQPLIEATYSHLQNISPLYNGLLTYDPETDDTDDLVCDLCTSWEVSEDGQDLHLPPAPQRQLVRRGAGHRRGRGLHLRKHRGPGPVRRTCGRATRPGPTPVWSSPTTRAPEL